MHYVTLDDSVVNNSSYYIINLGNPHINYIQNIHNNRRSYYDRNIGSMNPCLITYYDKNNEKILTYNCNFTNTKINLKNKLDINSEFPELAYYRKMSNYCAKTGNFYGIELLDKYFNSIFVMETDDKFIVDLSSILCINHADCKKIIDCNKLTKLEDNFGHKTSWFLF